MDIALISPKGPLYRHSGGIFKKDLRAAPLTLTTLAALVPTDLDASVRIIDEGVEDIPDSVRADIIGMTVITGSAPRCYELASRFREEGKTVVLGGPHVTLVPEEAALHADSIVTGYAEETWPRLLRDWQVGQLEARYDMGADFSLTRPDNLVMPARHLLKKRHYKVTSTFEATRGCIHNCEFCVVPSAWGRRPYQKPVAHVVDEIRRVGAKQIVFYDLNLFANFNYARELMQALIPLKVKWFGLSTVLIAKDPSLVELAARSGCVGLLIGFESVSTGSLSTFQKRFNNPNEYPELIRMLHQNGIAINGTFVFGADGESTTVFDEVRDFVLTQKIDLPRFSVLTPFPGTPLFKRLEASGRILTKDWSLYDGQHVVFEPDKMTVEELTYCHERVWQEVYSYGGMARRLRVSIGKQLLIMFSNFAYRYYAANLSRVYNCQGGMA